MLFFFFNDTATTEIYTLSLHDALPICDEIGRHAQALRDAPNQAGFAGAQRPDEGHDFMTGAGLSHSLAQGDRKSTRLNSSHGYISYAVFCLKKKKKHMLMTTIQVRTND